MSKSWDDFTGDDRIDSRDLIEAVEELTDELEDRTATEEETAFLAEVEEIASYCADWQYGESLIREDCFEDYARELAEDIGAIASDSAWPTYCIDWERAARELAVDYSLVTFLGHDYYVRN